MVAAVLIAVLATHVLGHHDAGGEHAVVPAVATGPDVADANALEPSLLAMVNGQIEPVADIVSAPPSDAGWHLTALECAVVLLLLGALLGAALSRRAPRDRAPSRPRWDTSPAWASAMTGALADRFALCVARV
jgi:hypothetical protein